MKLKPRPNDSKLAKLVAKLLDYVPIMSVRAKLRLESKLYDLDFQLRSEADRNIMLQRTYYKLLDSASMARFNVSVDSSMAEDLSGNVCTLRVRIQFDPLQYNFMVSPMPEKLYIDDEVHYMLRKVSYKLAQAIADQYEPHIYDLAMQKYNILTQKPKTGTVEHYGDNTSRPYQY